MFGFKKRDRASEIEAALQESWIEFAAGAAIGVELTVVLRAGRKVPDDVHYALRAEMRPHVVDMIKSCLVEKLTLDDHEIRSLAHRIQTSAVQKLEETYDELLIMGVLTGGTGLFVKSVEEIFCEARA
jgi:hypothetical protein